MKISIVIPAFNEEKLIATSLEHVKSACVAFSERGWSYEIVVCDNNSDDRTAELAKAAGAQVVFEAINQIGRARNTGARHASGDWLIFVDADSHPSRELLRDFADLVANGRALAGGSTVQLDEVGVAGTMLLMIWNTVSRVCRWAAGSFIFCETNTFRELGGFDLSLFAGEEVELSKRLKKAARERNKKMVILRGHPILTSARKLKLYSFRRHVSFFARALMLPRRTLRDRKACSIWYDGCR